MNYIYCIYMSLYICTPQFWSMFIEELELFLGARPGSSLSYMLILFLYLYRIHWHDWMNRK